MDNKEETPIEDDVLKNALATLEWASKQQAAYQIVEQLNLDIYSPFAEQVERRLSRNLSEAERVKLEFVERICTTHQSK